MTLSRFATYKTPFNSKTEPLTKYSAWKLNGNNNNRIMHVSVPICAHRETQSKS